MAETRTKAETFCDAALTAFLAGKEERVEFKPPYNPYYLRDIMQGVIKRRGKQGKVMCGTSDHKIWLMRSPKDGYPIKPVPAPIPKENAYKAKVTLERFMASGRTSALVEGGKPEYMALYRLCGLKKYNGIRVRLVKGAVYLERQEDGR